jgi:hypothetical protein
VVPKRTKRGGHDGGGACEMRRYLGWSLNFPTTSVNLSTTMVNLPTINVTMLSCL